MAYPGQFPRYRYVAARVPSRGEQAMRWLLQAANRHGLDIYDRNHGTGIFPFPEE